ncbi:11406_t:CDS:2, partial [Cetraspora pellucida]
TPSTSKLFKNAYTISVKIEAETKSEFWHGNIWQESPLFGSHSIRINHELYSIGSFIKYKDKEIRIRRITAIVSTSNGIKLKIQLLYFAFDLPGMFACSKIEQS